MLRKEKRCIVIDIESSAIKFPHQRVITKMWFEDAFTTNYYFKNVFPQDQQGRLAKNALTSRFVNKG